MLSKEDLMVKTKKQLLEIAKMEDIPKRWDMNKEEIVDEIIRRCTENKKDDKLRYLSTVKLGSLIAFNLPDGTTKSAAIKFRDTENKVLTAETKYGAAYIIPFKDVIWIKTGKRWPKGVYRKLKGLEVDENE